jgi:hypothetical protein
MDVNTTENEIWKTFRIKRNDTTPMVGWTGNRNTLAEMFATLGFKIGAEIGVQRGVYSEKLCKSIPGLHLICVDPWAAFNHTTDETNESFFQETKTRLLGYDVEYLRMKSSEAHKQVPDESLDFIYIDGLHEFDPVMIDLISWSYKVKVGGVIALHDFYPHYQGGVIDAVNAYTKAHNISNWYLTTEQPPTVFWTHKGLPRKQW